MDADLDKHKSLQLPHTCQWFFNNLDYQDWLTATASRHLCLRGVPGSGKSIVSAALILDLQHDARQATPILYFFCKQNDQNRDSTSNIIRTLLLQLASHPVHGNTLCDILHQERSSGIVASNYSQQRLWGILKMMLDMIPAVYVILDALDECNRHEELKELLEEFTAFSVTSGNVVKLFTTYRPNEFEISWPSIDVEERDVEADVKAYASHRIDKSPTLSRPDSSPRQIQEVLTDVPRGLSNTYNLMLERACDREPRAAERCRKVLHWCVAARRLFTVDELLLALAVSEGASSHETYKAETDLPESLRILRLECGSLIHVLKDSRVRLLHTSLREYLVHQDTKPSSEHLKTTSRMKIADLSNVHRDLAMICLRYNQFACFQVNLDMEKLKEYEEEFPLSRYAICTWIYHVCNSGDSHSYLANALGTFLHSIQGWRWLQRCDSFDISRGHLHNFQGDLKAWILQSEVQCHNHQTTYGPLRNFMLHLAQSRYSNATQENEEQDNQLVAAEIELGVTNDELGQYNEALEWYGRALTGYEKTLGEEHPSTLDTVHSMAVVYNFQGRYVEALEWCGRALTGKEKALGEEHPSTLATVDNMAVVYKNQGRYEEALEWYGRALTGKEKALGEEHPSTLDTVHNMANVYDNQGRYEEALEWYGRALTGKEKVLGEEHPSTLATVHNMAGVYDSQGRYEKALEWYGRALTGAEKALVNNIASVYDSQGRYVESLEWYGRALAGKEKALGEEHPSTLRTVNNMANVYDCQGRYEKALEWYGRALTGAEKALGEEHPSTLRTVNNMAVVYKNQGRYVEALEWYGRALTGYAKALGEEHPSTLDTVHNMAVVYKNQGRYAEALQWCGRALAGKEKVLGEEHPSTLATVHNMANVYDCQGRYEKALEWYGRALTGAVNALGKDHPLALLTARCIRDTREHLGGSEHPTELTPGWVDDIL
ncbi:hypothetical protein Q9L58_006250 [Maublancomyces gigas]|uniref:TPR-like protein n=1 Tax=Discina gigas TaxID=1032678 RepID=A0ABR3GFV4_9PEZI